MNKKTLKIIAIYSVIFIITTLVINLHRQESSFIEIPWTLLIIFIILILQQIPWIKPKAMAGIIFICLLIFFRLNVGHATWGTWIIYFILDIILTTLFYFGETHRWWNSHK